jgi:poly-gamma-glutamate synthesis protein (capsule biosynthesis protein)
MVHRISSIAVLLFLSVCGLGQKDPAATLRILFAGDIMGHDSQIQAARIDSSDRYDYSGCFRHLAPCLREADIAVGNLEVTHAGPPFKGYPRFSSPDELTAALREYGFHVMVNANNHALDRGKEGFERTHTVLKDHGMILTGTFRDPGHRELSYPLILEKNGILIALLNYTYGTNGIVPDTPNIVNYLDTILIRQDIQKADLVEPDFIIACIHWGKEYEREASPEQHQLAEFLFDHGVDAVIGSHPHVIQPVEFIKTGMYYSRPVVYSLGNFVSNQRNRYRNGGILFGLELEKRDRTRITGLDYLPVYVHKPKEGDRYRFELVPADTPDERLEELGFTTEDMDQYIEFVRDTREHLSNVPPASLPLLPGGQSRDPSESE